MGPIMSDDGENCFASFTRPELEMLAWKDDGLDIWVSFCPGLDIHAQGDSVEEALLGLESAIHLKLKHMARIRKDRLPKKPKRTEGT